MCRKLRRKVRLSGCIGSGGFGTVFLAHKNTPHGQANFAIKINEHNTIAAVDNGSHVAEMMFFEEGGKVSNPPLCLYREGQGRDCHVCLYRLRYTPTLKWNARDGPSLGH